MLLYETVEQDGQRGEADVVQSQVGCIVQRLERKERLIHFLDVFLRNMVYFVSVIVCLCTYLLWEPTEELVEELGEDETDILGREGKDMRGGGR